jgi:NAD(P)-dependent dehydrogenase (short-subunit alcohol dehydrogenase family)
MQLRDHVVVITGASRGLGEAVAKRLARDGAHLVLAARDATALSHVANGILNECQAKGQQIVQQPTDVVNPAEVQRLIERASDMTGRIDALIANAGIYGPMGPSETVDWDAWTEAININLLGTALSCRAVVPIMRRQGRGKIILLSGGGATAPLPRLSAYAASKAAVVRFGETLAEEVKSDGISVNSVAPGALNTRLLDQVLEAGPDAVGPEFHARALRQRETGGTPLETPAELIAFLVSSASDGITGRLLSAVWDDWRNLPHQLAQLTDSDVYTLRRIVPEDRGWGKD